MDSTVLVVAWYRLRATFRRRSGGYLAIVLLIGLVGGLAMGSIAGARRTQSSYPTFLASPTPSDLNVSVYAPATEGGAGPNLTAKIAHLAGVRRVRDVAANAFVPLSASGAPRLNIVNDVSVLSSLDGEFFGQDRLTAVEGRMSNPKRADEIVMTASAARLLGVRVGQVIPLGYYTPAQMGESGFGTPTVVPRLLVRARLVGIVVIPSQLVQDDVDQAYGFAMITPALDREVIALSPAAGAVEGYGLQ